MSQLIMLIGVAGSGKSTWAKKYYDDALNSGIRTIIISSDAIRKELFGDESDQTHNTEVFEEVHLRIHAALHTYDTVIYDATNLNRKRRIAFLKTIRGICYKKAVVFPITDKQVIKRIELRERKVPLYAINRQFRQMEFPQWYEGWDEIDIHLDPENMISYMEVFDECNLPHRNHHHTLDIIPHMIAVGSHFAQKNYPQWLEEAALLHDCGKGFAREFLNTKGEVTEEAHYYGHEHYGAQLSLLLPTADNTPYSRIARAQLIDLHMEPLRRTEESLKKLYDLIDMNRLDSREYSSVESWMLKELSFFDGLEA